MKSLGRKLVTNTAKLKKECPLDKKCEWEFFYYSQFSDFNLPIFKCKKCELQALSPDAREQPEELYNESYYLGKAKEQTSAKDGKEYFIYKDERKFEKFERFVWHARINSIKRFLYNHSPIMPENPLSSGNLNFLDIGSSFGGFLQTAKEAGFNAYGIEIAKYAAEYAKKRGLAIFNGDLLNAKYKNQFFHVITLIEVIEHLANPDKVFNKLSELLGSGGLLVIQTANFSGWQAIKEKENYHYYLPGHFYYYNAELLLKILQKRGFSKFKIHYGVDFGLLPKLLKSRGNFKWFKITWYHFKSRLFYKNRPLTSSMVLYAIKD